MRPSDLEPRVVCEEYGNRGENPTLSRDLGKPAILTNNPGTCYGYRNRSAFRAAASQKFFRSMVRTRPRHAVHTAKTPSVRQPQRNRGLLSPIAYYRNYRPAAGIDPIVLRAVLISWNDIRIPVRPDDRDPNVNTNGFDRSRLPFGSRRQGRRRKGQYNNKRSEQAVGALHDSSPDGPMHSLRVTGVCRKGAS